MSQCRKASETAVSEAHSAFKYRVQTNLQHGENTSNCTLSHRERFKPYATPSCLKERIYSEIGEGNNTKKDTSFGCFTVVITRRKTLWHSHIKNMTGTPVRLQQSQTHTCRMTKFANIKTKIYGRPSKAAFRKNEKVFQEGSVQWPVGLVKANRERFSSL